MLHCSISGDHYKWGITRDPGWSERLVNAGATPSVGSAGAAYDNAFAESGRSKTQAIHHAGPERGFDDVEFATLEWVAWFNTQRMIAPLGGILLAGYEEQFYRSQHNELPALN